MKILFGVASALIAALAAIALLADCPQGNNCPAPKKLHAQIDQGFSAVEAGVAVAWPFGRRP